MSCFHALCTACLGQHVAFDGGVKCPKCFTKTLVPTASPPVSALPNTYPKLAQGEISSSSIDVRVKVMCDECAKDEPATANCADCGANLCQTHAAAHPLFRATRDHKMTSLSAEQAETAVVAQRFAQHYCGVHPNQVLSQYCIVCNQLACQQCLDTGAHSEAQHEVLGIEQAAHSVREHLEKEVRHCISDGNAVIQTTVDKLGLAVENLHSDALAASVEVVSSFRKLKEALEAREKLVLAEIDRLRDDKLALYERQAERLQASLFQGQAAKDIAEACNDDVDLLKMSSWLNDAIAQRKRVLSDDVELCTASQIVFSADNIEKVSAEIQKAGATFELADSIAQITPVVQDAFVNADMKITVEGGNPPLPTVSTEYFQRLRFKISVRSAEDEDLPTSAMELVEPNRLLSKCKHLAAPGPLTVSVQFDGKHLQGSPMQIDVTQYEPTWESHDGQGKTLRYSTSASSGQYYRGHTLTSGWSGYIPNRYGKSMIRLRIDRIDGSNMYICACSAAKPKANGVHDDPSELFGWRAADSAEPICNGGRLGQPWKTGDILRLELNHDNRTLTGYHERTGRKEVLHHASDALRWYVTLFKNTDQVTMLS